MNNEDLMRGSKAILNEAIARYQPYAKVLMFSGGSDSMAALHTCLRLGVRPDYILHVNTRTGIKETTQFVRQYVESLGIPYVEADAGSAYRDYVLRKGFFGVGTGRHSAHSYAYHVLKGGILRSALSQTIRQGKRGRPILLLNGARLSESDNRAKNFAGQEIRPDESSPNNIWVNVIHHWQKADCRAMCGELKCPKNAVSELLCRSGECMCGTTQGMTARAEATYWFPEWGAWLDKLEAEVMQRFPWGWGQVVPKSWLLEKQGQLRLFDGDFQPMCSSCIATQEVQP